MLWWIHNVWIPCDLRTCCSTWAWAEQWDTSSIYPRKKQVELGLGDLISHVICTVRKHIQGRNDSIEINDSPRTTNLCTHKNITIISIYVVPYFSARWSLQNLRQPAGDFCTTGDPAGCLIFSRVDFSKVKILLECWYFNTRCLWWWKQVLRKKKSIALAFMTEVQKEYMGQRPKNICPRIFFIDFLSKLGPSEFCDKKIWIFGVSNNIMI